MTDNVQPEMKDRDPKVTLLTCSFRGDFDLCKMMCESVDRFVPGQISHLVYVPKSDFPLFGELTSERRKMLPEDGMLPRWFRKVPLPPAKWRKRLKLPRRNIYWTPYSRPVRGWIAQQIMKLQAAAGAPTEIILHVDSDIEFVRPMTIERLMPKPGLVRLYQFASPAPMDSHILWHQTAYKLLGVPDPGPSAYQQDYIGSVVVWRRSVVRKLLQEIERVGGRDWRIVLARTPHFSEYILYGTFATRVLGLAEAGHVVEPSSLCLCRWSDEFKDAAGEREFVEALEPGEVACCLQSTLAITLAERRRIFERVAEFAARQV